MNRPSNKAIGNSEARAKLVRPGCRAERQERGEIVRTIDVPSELRARQSARCDADAPALGYMPSKARRPEPWLDDIRGPAGEQIRAAIAGRGEECHRPGCVEQIDDLRDRRG